MPGRAPGCWAGGALGAEVWGPRAWPQRPLVSGYRGPLRVPPPQPWPLASAPQHSEGEEARPLPKNVPTPGEGLGLHKAPFY